MIFTYDERPSTRLLSKGSSHFVWQDLDPVGFIWDFRDRIYHVDCKDAKRQTGNGRNGRMGSHLAWADPRRGWDFVSTGHGDVPWEACFRMLNTIDYTGPISIEWEDAGMDRLIGAPEAAVSHAANEIAKLVSVYKGAVIWPALISTAKSSRIILSFDPTANALAFSSKVCSHLHCTGADSR